MIPFLDLRALNAPYDAEFQEKFKAFLEKGWFILGDEVRLFEEEFAAYCGTKHCIGTANGLDALRLILEGYKILGKLSEGDEVLVASNTYIATILGIRQAGLVPVLVEANLETYNFDFADLQMKVTVKTKVVMPTHLYGQLADMEAMSAFAKANNVLIVTDSAQSHGAKTSQGKRSGNLGDASGFSFYPTKNLGALGDGGAITTNDSALAEVVRSYRNYGFKERYVSAYEGLNSRLDEIQAAFLRIKLRDLDTSNTHRRAIATRYINEIKNPKITLPSWNGSEDHVFHLFVIRCKIRAHLCDYLKTNGVGTIIHYPVPPHQQAALKDYNNVSFPVTEQIHDEVVSIPLNPVMDDAMVSQVISILNSY
ncbi:aminotransferase [Dokdonia pacifica]|uniref:dTDP-4-amino-4,6-dideoxygalactose transaminase n=1 Tax=Dokdonia pacifica TaxID=1627892 RepID=A0A238ZGG1_9FLAO|nr:DegT/DnrJ/EryC1/StrS family aminotransferase [Dokdonia pacifica]GGG06163.1 aminotransferase [Dokdonia pacifica]SNR82081.1 dTDP-4-amino-4,6-dideoxygalactose transaminase [Dokdonia pacifica]